VATQPRRFLLVALGSTADAAPFLALGHALRAAGHQATLLAAPSLRRLAESAGLAFISLPQLGEHTAAEPLLDLPVEPAALAALYSRFAPLFGPLLDAVIAELPKHDALVASHLFPFLKNAAAAAHRSFAVLVFNPSDIPFAHAAPTAPPAWLPKFLQSAHRRRSLRTRESQLDQIVRLYAGPALHEHHLGSFSGFLRAPADLALVVVSPKLFPPPAPPPRPYLYTGFLRPPPAHTPSESLAPVAALARAGAPVTAIALDGLAPTPEMEILPRLLAAWPAGLPLILHSNRIAHAPDSSRPEILHVIAAPLDELFSLATIVVHSGSAETTAAALHAGRPQILVPPRPSYWTQTLPALGVARVLDSATWPELLAAAVDADLRKIALVRRVAECAAIVRAENGPARAVAELEKL
jgi:UDP:flavonoid glycosyltransferase YjiC (YdhE family)